MSHPGQSQLFTPTSLRLASFFNVKEPILKALCFQRRIAAWLRRPIEILALEFWIYEIQNSGVRKSRIAALTNYVITIIRLNNGDSAAGYPVAPIRRAGHRGHAHVPPRRVAHFFYTKSLYFFSYLLGFNSYQNRLEKFEALSQTLFK